MKLIKHEINVFFTALMFYTRIPCPAWIGHSDEMLNQATRYFPVIGYIVGGISTITFILGAYFFNGITAIILSVASAILTTGAFHEDGFADTCDGFGGGWTKDRILLIMKDSTTGAYGVIGLILLFALKISLLAEILIPIQSNYLIVFIVFVCGHSLSRFFASTLIYFLPYSRDTDDSKSKPVAKGVNPGSMILSFIMAIIPVVLLCRLLSHFWPVLILPPLIICVFLLGNYFKKWIGGYTGDCLGAAQQISEVVIYLSMAFLWRYTL